MQQEETYHTIPVAKSRRALEANTWYIHARLLGNARGTPNATQLSLPCSLYSWAANQNQHKKQPLRQKDEVFLRQLPTYAMAANRTHDKALLTPSFTSCCLETIHTH